MAYSVRIGDTVLGWSDLEYADAGMSIVTGAFRPAPGYEHVRPVFLLYSQAVPESSAQAADEAKLQRYWRKRDALGLSLHDPHGHRIQTEAIHVFDSGGEVVPAALELEVIIADPGFWAAYHPCV